MKQELKVARAAAQGAGAIVLSLYEKDIDVQMKGANDPVTIADRRANGLIVAALERAFPADAILAEESGASGVRQARRRWFVDPLDGTKEFLARNGEFAVMVGLSIDGQAVLGVVYQPAIDLLLEGVVGDGAWATERGARREVRVSEAPEPSQMRLVVSRSHRDPLVDAVKLSLGIRDERICGSVGVKIGLLVRQEADLYVHPGRGVKLWDTCAPEAILAAGGGRMTDASGQRIAYGASDPALNAGIISSNGRAHDQVVAAVLAARRQAG